MSNAESNQSGPNSTGQNEENADFEILTSITEIECSALILGSHYKDVRDEFIIRKLDIDVDTLDNIGEMFLEQLKKAKKDNLIANLKEYDPGEEAPKHEPRWYNFTEDDIVNRCIQAIDHENTAEISFYRHGIRGNGRIKYCSLVASHDGSPIRFYANLPSVRRVAQSKAIELIPGANGRYIRLEQDPITINSEFCAILYRGRLYIFGDNKFDRLFDLTELLKEFGADFFTPDNLGQFKLARFVDNRNAIIRNKNYTKKLRIIKARPRTREVGVEAFRESIEAGRYGENLRIIGTGDEAELDCPPENVDELLKVLVDYYVKSPVTGTDYGAEKKRTLSQK